MCIRDSSITSDKCNSLVEINISPFGNFTNTSTIKSLITKIELLGYGKVSFTRTAQGVVIDMPDVQLNKICLLYTSQCDIFTHGSVALNP